MANLDYGPNGSSERFKATVAKLIAKGMNPVRARRVASGINKREVKK